MRDWTTRKLIDELGIDAKNVKGHWEVNNNTACPRYTKAEMDAFREWLSP
ncbi:hypothetical protein QP433_07390 [Facklamia hominis]|uniref:N-acetylmuramoyl-L-alanine amidase domain-containing protein n=1 Tax=Facklamia hominis TaxID=178214 RepID=A0AAJ1V3W7_9LACT|nr:hypothetical protein [Facklamia hominis]